MDAELRFWLIVLVCAIVFVAWSIRQANKNLYVTWVEELQDKY